MALSTFGFIFDPLNFTQKCYNRGDKFVHLPGIPIPYLQINDPQLAKNFFLKNHEYINKPDIYKKSAKKYQSYGVLFNDGPSWESARQLIKDNWSPEREVWAQKVESILEKHLEHWPGEFILKNQMNAITLDLTCEALIGMEPMSYSRAVELTELMMILTQRSYDSMFPPIYLAKSILPKYMTANKKFADLIHFLKNSHVAKFPIEEVMSYLIAGVEATASVLNWGCVELARQKLGKQEGPRYSTFAKEIMRYYPPGYFLMRENSIELEIEGVVIPKKTLINYPLLWVHRDEKFFKNAHVVDEKRFDTIRPPAEYTPFGIGKRICAGANYAPLEIEKVFEMMATRCELTLKGKVIEDPFMSLRPSFKGELKVKKRKP